MPNEMETPSASMIGIGDKLKKTRERKALTIDQVQRQTHIHSEVLTALEDGRCDEILNPTYVRSFLKKYAEYLGMDTREILSDYSKVNSGRVAPKINMNVASPSSHKESSTVLQYVIVTAVAFFIILALSFVTLVGFRLLTAAPKKVKRAEKTVSQTKRGAKANWNANTKKKMQNVSLAQSADIPRSVPLNIVIKTKAPVWIELKKDGDKIFQRVMPKGMSESITAREKAELFIANGEVVEIILNGKSFGSPGKGIIRNLEITRSGLKIR